MKFFSFRKIIILLVIFLCVNYDGIYCFWKMELSSFVLLLLRLQYFYGRNADYFFPKSDEKYLLFGGVTGIVNHTAFSRRLTTQVFCISCFILAITATLLGFFIRQGIFSSLFPSETNMIRIFQISRFSEGFSTTPQYIWSMVSIYSNLLIYFLKVTSK